MLESIPIPRPPCNVYFGQLRLPIQIGRYLFNAGALFAAAQRHRIAAVRN